MPVLTVVNRTSARLPVDSVVNVLEANESRVVSLTGQQLELVAPKLVAMAASSLITWSVASSSAMSDNPAEPVLGGSVVLRGVGSPAGAVLGSVGDLYVDSAGGAGTTLWVKESGNLTTAGWVAK